MPSVYYEVVVSVFLVISITLYTEGKRHAELKLHLLVNYPILDVCLTSKDTDMPYFSAWIVTSRAFNKQSQNCKMNVEVQFAEIWK